MWFEIVGLLLSITVFGIAGMQLFRSKIYNVMIVHLTSQWYKGVLYLLSYKSKLLGVGIGTGQALIDNKAQIIDKEIQIDGVDYDLDNVKQCQLHIANHGLENFINVRHESVLDYRGGPYDAIYFSASLMILPDPVEALNHVKNMLVPNGKIYVTQTIQTNKSILTELGKPLLKYITTIDFGSVTYENDLLNAFRKAKLTIKLNQPISGSSFNDSRSFRLFVLERC